MQAQGFLGMNKRNTSGQLNRRLLIWRFVFWQFFWVVVCCYTATLCAGKHALIACLLAGVVVLLPQMFFVVCMFSYAGATSARRVVNGFYFGEAAKLVMTAGLVGLSVYWFSPKMGWFLTTLIGAYMAYVWVPLCLEKGF